MARMSLGYFSTAFPEVFVLQRNAAVDRGFRSREWRRLSRDYDCFGHWGRSDHGEEKLPDADQTRRAGYRDRVGYSRVTAWSAYSLSHTHIAITTVKKTRPHYRLWRTTSAGFHKPHMDAPHADRIHRKLLDKSSSAH